MPLEYFVDHVVPRMLGTIDVLVFELVVPDAPDDTNVRPELAVEARTFQTNKTRQDLAAQGKVLLGLDKGDPGRTGFGTIRTDLVAGDPQYTSQALLALDRLGFGFGFHPTMERNGTERNGIHQQKQRYKIEVSWSFCFTPALLRR